MYIKPPALGGFLKKRMKISKSAINLALKAKNKKL
jgi:hypothetical protein